MENPPFRINISLYGGCNETYKNMCGQSVYDKVLKNIVNLKNGKEMKIRSAFANKYKKSA